MFRRSSAVEQLTVNQLVVGSIPTAGANYPNITISYRHPARERLPAVDFWKHSESMATGIFRAKLPQLIALRDGNHQRRFDQICNDHHDPDRSEFERQMDILGLRAK